MTRRLRVAGRNKDPDKIKAATTIPALVTALGHFPSSFQVVSVTDGSGSRIGKPTGSAAMIKRHGYSHRLLTTSATSGSSTTAELDAILLSLRHFHQQKLHLQKGGCKTLFITDSEVVQKYLTSVAKDPIRLYNSFSHPDVAAALLAFARRGFVFTVARIPRNSTPIHSGVDAASRAARLGQSPQKAYRIAFDKHANRSSSNGQR